jgi:hypothetical protein
VINYAHVSGLVAQTVGPDVGINEKPDNRDTARQGEAPTAGPLVPGGRSGGGGIGGGAHSLRLKPNAAPAREQKLATASGERKETSDDGCRLRRPSVCGRFARSGRISVLGRHAPVVGEPLSAPRGTESRSATVSRN